MHVMDVPFEVWFTIVATAILCVLAIVLVERRRWSPNAKIVVIGLTLFVLMNIGVFLAVRMLTGGVS